MEPDFDDFKEFFPEFSELSEDRFDYFITVAKCSVGEAAFGECYIHALYLVLAHILTLSDPSRATSAEKSSEKVGDISVSYNVSSVGGRDAYFLQTQYGKQFIELRNSRVVCPMIVDC